MRADALTFSKEYLTVSSVIQRLKAEWDRLAHASEDVWERELLGRKVAQQLPGRRILTWENGVFRLLPDQSPIAFEMIPVLTSNGGAETKLNITHFALLLQEALDHCQKVREALTEREYLYGIKPAAIMLAAFQVRWTQCDRAKLPFKNGELCVDAPASGSMLYWKQGKFFLRGRELTEAELIRAAEIGDVSVFDLRDLATQASLALAALPFGEGPGASADEAVAARQAELSELW